jgi:hypothetical protein
MRVGNPAKYKARYQIRSRFLKERIDQKKVPFQEENLAFQDEKSAFRTRKINFQVGKPTFQLSYQLTHLFSPNKRTKLVSGGRS